MRGHTGYPGLHPGLQGVAATRLLTIADHYFLSFAKRGNCAAVKLLGLTVFLLYSTITIIPYLSHWEADQEKSSFEIDLL
jgi:hypothetical protein